eukprot:scaffold165060_cov45-Prasinocladus_malaysianus.AAC.1
MEDAASETMDLMLLAAADIARCCSSSNTVCVASTLAEFMIFLQRPSDSDCPQGNKRELTE